MTEYLLKRYASSANHSAARYDSIYDNRDLALVHNGKLQANHII